MASSTTEVTATVDTKAPTISSVVANPATANLDAGNTVALTVNFSENVIVAGTPFLTLNDGGTAIYIGGTGTNSLTFSYTVASTDSTVSALAITQANLPNGAHAILSRLLMVAPVAAASEEAYEKRKRIGRYDDRSRP